MEIVDGRGQVVNIAGGADSITLGALGVVATITLKVVPMFWLRHDVKRVDDIVTATANDTIDALLAANDFIFFRWSSVADDDPATYNTATMETFNHAAERDITPIKSAACTHLLTLVLYNLKRHGPDNCRRK